MVDWILKYVHFKIKLMKCDYTDLAGRLEGGDGGKDEDQRM